jgi:hypothetical protein
MPRINTTNVHINIPDHLLAEVRTWTAEPRKLSQVFQYLIVSEIGRRQERQRIQASLADVLQDPVAVLGQQPPEAGEQAAPRPRRGRPPKHCYER